MMANEESLDKELTDLFPLPLASLAKDANATVAKRPRPRTAGPASKVVVAALATETPAELVTALCKINGTVAKAGAARAKAITRALYILDVNLVRN